MARTYRNRSTVPKGGVVRDDGRLYWHGERWGKSWCRGLARSGIPRYRRGYQRCERKAYRHEHYRKFRARCRQRMAHEDWENLPRCRRTGGWLSW